MLQKHKVAIVFKFFKPLLLVVLFFSSLAGETYSYTNLLKECGPEQIQALQELSVFLGLNETTQFHSLAGGMTRAKLYTFEAEGKKLVLRFLALTPSQTKEMRQNEIHALKIGNKLGIAPGCIFSDQNAVLVVMPFIEGHALRQSEDHQLIQLGSMLKILHNYPGPYPTRYPLKDRIKLHYQKGIKSGIAYPTGFDQEVETVLNTLCLRTTVPTHGDLNLSNILVNDSSIILIDWTTATWDDPFADLSYFCLLSDLTDDQEKIFLESYFEKKLENEHQTLKEEKAKICLLTAVLWLRFSETEEEQSLPLALRIFALDNELHSPDLKSIQDYLREGIVVDLNTASKPAIKSYALSFYKAYLQVKNRL